MVLLKELPDDLPADSDSKEGDFKIVTYWYEVCDFICDAKKEKVVMLGGKTWSYKFDKEKGKFLK